MARKNRTGNLSGLGNPLAVAIEERDRGALSLVQAAIDRGDVMLAYQPVMEATRPKRPAFHEALIRVLDANGRVIQAKDFMTAVETLELGRQLDCRALELGLKALGRAPRLRLSVNMSARSMGYGPWMDILRKVLRSAPHLGERLILEITEESAMLMPDLVTVFMREVQGTGVGFALDDFGAGMTSFRHLRDFYFDLVKIDGQFIRGISTSVDDQILVQALVAIARQFDMFTVAEQVESEEDAALLRALGVDCLQGYLYGAPTTAPPWQSQRQGGRRKRAA